MSLDILLLKRLQAVDTPTICNAIEVAQNKRGFRTLRISKCFAPNQMRRQWLAMP